MLLKNIHLHSVNLLNFVYNVFDIEIALENAKWAILERLEWQFFLALPQVWLGAEFEIFLRKILRYFIQKPECHL